MAMQRFVHIHNHTEYSLLDGANRIPQLVARAKELGQEALAITDHGVMFGAMEFYTACKSEGVKPIVGMEAYIAPNGIADRRGREENQTYHLVLLARNAAGYRNLCRLHSIAALQGFYYKPRVDHDLLRAHAEGLIGTSACLGSEVCQELLGQNYERAQYLAGMYKELFEPGCFFIELQDHGLEEQARIREPLARIAKELDLPLVCTNDAHYLCRGDDYAHDVLLCIGTNALLKEEHRLRFDTPEFYLKSSEEMAALFGDVPEAIENTVRIAEMCDLELEPERALMPEPERPEGVGVAEYLRQLAEQGLRERLPGAADAAWERLNFELDVIGRTGFEDYFLLVREFTQFTRSQGIAFGVRGSAAGSLTSFCLGITDVDPLGYGLTFERFLNPERLSMPDIDLDFEDERRDEVIRWVSDRYGSDRVAQIVTFGTLGARAALRDAGRVMGWAPQDVDRICKTIPNTPGITLERAQEELPEFRETVASDARVAELVGVARGVEGLARHPGVHAAGLVISREPLSEHVPLYRSQDGQAITAYDMSSLEKLGLLKMDFLGLSNLTVLARTARLVRETRGIEIDPEQVPLDDGETFAMLGRGETIGVFQLEGSGMRAYVRELKPSSVADLSAMVALYRPGPMKHISTYIDGKHGRVQPTYLHEKMQPILEETYGVIVYQDQVLRLVQALAGFSLGRADILRRAMGKKDAAAMDSMHEEFVAGCRGNGLSASVAEQVWSHLMPFAGYAFNKAHAVCYALLAYRTAYLKCHFPVEYMTALLAVYRTKEDRVVTCIEECRRRRIPVLPPDVNASEVDFSIDEGKSIRFGLSAIKGIGEGFVRAMIQERARRPFRHLYEFAERMRPHGLNRSSLEALVRAGALASIEPNRAVLKAYIDAALVFADSANRSRQIGQDSLFGGEGSVGDERYPRLGMQSPPSRSDVMADEREVMGIYLSDHPLRGYRRVLENLATHSCRDALEAGDSTKVRLAGVVTALRTPTTKQTGKKMAAFTIEDYTGQVSCMAFPSAYERIADVLKPDAVVAVEGTMRAADRARASAEIELRVDGASAVPQPPESDLAETPGTVEVRILKATRPQLLRLRELLAQHPGDYSVSMRVGGNGASPEDLPYRVEPSTELLASIKETLASCQVSVLEGY